jgi:mannosylglycoprotein endo-beta-mannosidase
MDRNRAPGLDGFPIEFFQKFWDLIEFDLLALFTYFYNGVLDIQCFNYRIVILLAKGKGADRLQMYRPICLLNVIFKIFTKVLNNRVMVIWLISNIQSAFIKGRYILDNVTFLHVTLHYMCRRIKIRGTSSLK